MADKFVSQALRWLDLGVCFSNTPELGGFGEVGEAVVCFLTMAKTLKRLGEIRDNVEADSINVELYVKELAVATMDFAKACG